MREAKKNKPVIIKDLLNQFFKERKKAGKSLESRIIDEWHLIMPEKAAECAKPVTIKNKILIISVSNSAWLHQLTLEKVKILQLIRKKLKTQEIIDIRFKIGK
ncbi:MAG: DUF721 domain-containing protein [Candidatus Omnitrophica bacterium]|nr:DUF721 domain-containing protein [Candidatus Omnitrophota bacterium]